MKPHNVSHPHCRCTRARRALNQPLVLNLAKACRQAVFLTQQHLLARGRWLGISDAENIARRAPGGARVTSPQLREILRLDDAQKTLIGLTQEDLRQVHKVAVPRHTTDRADLAY